MIRKALERLQYEEVPVVSESTGIIPHTPEVSYREERAAALDRLSDPREGQPETSAMLRRRIEAEIERLRTRRPAGWGNLLAAYLQMLPPVPPLARSDEHTPRGQA